MTLDDEEKRALWNSERFLNDVIALKLEIVFKCR